MQQRHQGHMGAAGERVVRAVDLRRGGVGGKVRGHDGGGEGGGEGVWSFNSKWV